MRCCSCYALRRKRRLQQFAELVVEDVLVQGLVLRLLRESQLVLSELLAVLQARAGLRYRRLEFSALRQLSRGGGGGADTLKHGVLLVSTMCEDDARTLVDFTAHISDGVHISNFAHSSGVVCG